MMTAPLQKVLLRKVFGIETPQEKLVLEDE